MHANRKGECSERSLLGVLARVGIIAYLAIFIRVILLDHDAHPPLWLSRGKGGEILKAHRRKLVDSKSSVLMSVHGCKQLRGYRAGLLLRV